MTTSTTPHPSRLGELTEAECWSLLHRSGLGRLATDGHDSERYWSVVIRGRAARLEDQTEIIRSGVLELVSWVPTETHEFIRIIPTAVVGRAIERARFGKASLFG